jgi:hypothetical protein
MSNTARLLWLGLILLPGCGDTGGERVSVALFASGTPARELLIGDARVVLTRAELAFGPAYFCASATASAELCAVAVAELRAPVHILALEPSEQAVGVLAAAIYDLGISWLLTQSEARASAAAPEGHSALLEGSIERAGRTLRFRAGIDATPGKRGELVVNTQRTEYELTGEGDALTLAIDANRWVDRLDVDALFALDTDGDGAVAIEQGTTTYEGILLGMVSRAPLGFGWRKSVPSSAQAGR